MEQEGNREENGHRMDKIWKVRKGREGREGKTSDGNGWKGMEEKGRMKRYDIMGERGHVMDVVGRCEKEREGTWKDWMEGTITEEKWSPLSTMLI